MYFNGRPEIAYFGYPVQKQNVLWLDVTVNNITVVQVGQPAGNVMNNKHRLSGSNGIICL